MIKNYSHIIFRTSAEPISNAYKPNHNISPGLREAILIASPDFLEQLEKSTSELKTNSAKQILSLRKFQIRSSVRATPFGTFSGIGTCNITTSESNIILDSPDNNKRVLKLDMAVVYALVDKLITIEQIKYHINYFPNNSIYEVFDNYRFVERVDTNGSIEYDLSVVKKTTYLKALLTKAEKGITIPELTSFLSKEIGATEDNCLTFIMQLVDSQLLVSDLEPSITENNPLNHIISKIQSLPNTKSTLNLLFELNSAQSQTIFNKQVLDNTRKILYQLGIQNQRNIFQVDLQVSTQKSEINQTIISEILTQFAEVSVIKSNYQSNNLAQFKSKFLEKYETQEIELSKVLDPDSGLGYANTTEDTVGESDYIINITSKKNNNQQEITLNDVQELALKKYIEFLEKGNSIIELSELDLNQFNNRRNIYPLPHSLYILGELFINHTKLDKFSISAVSGQSAMNLFARFANNSAGLMSLSNEISKFENQINENYIVAEIIHIPEFRTCNILKRPQTREFEIPYVGKSCLPETNQIPIKDILVSVRNGQIYLRSKKLNKYILPRLTSAHNYVKKSLPVYHFLCDLQFQYTSVPILWNWGVLTEKNYLPRVQYKNLIIQKARWIIKQSDFNGSDNLQASFIRNHLLTKKIPSRVLLVENDNKLLIDFEKNEGVDIFLKTLRTKTVCHLEEFLYDNYNSIITDQQHRQYVNELIIPIKIEKPETKLNAPNNSLIVQSHKRTFNVYDNWIFLKIYCGSFTAEKILSAILLPFVKKYMKGDSMLKFFFVRYFDSANHLRIRFYNPDKNKNIVLINSLVNKIRTVFRSEEPLKFQIDTYNRELERYGPRNIEEVESIFFYDSLCTLEILNTVKVNDYKIKILIGIMGIDKLLSDFGFSQIEKQMFSKLQRDYYFNEFGSNQITQKILNSKYRTFQSEIFEIMSDPLNKNKSFRRIRSLFDKRSNLNKNLAASLLKRNHAIKNKRKVFNLLASICHMSINRLFIGHQRKYEYLIYHFLEKNYSSQVAKKGS